jgi:hypothetical protein
MDKKMKVSNNFSPLLTRLQRNNTNKNSSFKTLSSTKVPKKKHYVDGKEKDGRAKVPDNKTDATSGGGTNKKKWSDVVKTSFCEKVNQQGSNDSNKQNNKRINAKISRSKKENNKEINDTKRKILKMEVNKNPGNQMKSNNLHNNSKEKPEQNSKNAMKQTCLKVISKDDKTKSQLWIDPSVKSNYEQFDSSEQVFLHEPYRASTETLTLTESLVSNLSERVWLTTPLIDFLIKHSINPSTQRNVVIPTSAIENLIDALLIKASTDKSWFDEKKKQYEMFSLKPFDIVMCTCTHGHYFVISLTFDPTDIIGGKIFKNVKIYDSLKHVHNVTVVTRNHNKCPATEFLKKFQKFMANFVLFNHPVANELTKNEGYICDSIQYVPCPQQKNMSDCSLFTLGVLLHVINGKHVDQNIFSQSTIDTFRKGLYKVLSANPTEEMKDPKKFVSRQFILSFFPLLNFVSIKKDPYVDYYHFGTDIPDLQNSSEDFEEETSKTSEYEYLSSASNYDSEDDSVEMLDQEEKKFLKEFQESINLRSSNPSNVLLVDNRDQELNSKYDDETDNNFIESIKAGMGNSGEKFKTNKCEEPETEGILDGNYCQVINPEETQPVGNNNPEILFRDDLFHQMFGTNNAEFEDLDHLGEAINEYESLTANRLATVKGEKVKQYRRYVCKQHIGCSFYASFGVTVQ